jgi:hypothetical protein
MALHLLKLCVGAESIGDLQAWIAERLKERRRRREPLEHWHVTRMVPKRTSELLDGGSIYWVIKGQIQARQSFIDVEPITEDDGTQRCRLRLDPSVVLVRARSCRPFQGWRYLAPADAPADFGSDAVDASHFPEPLRRELVELGLL